MNYSLIGTGNVAWFFGKRLKEAGHTCIGIYGRNARAANALAKEVYATDCGFLSDVKNNTDICILAISDSIIEEIVQQISFSGTVLVHTAGAMSINILSNATKDHGVIWPVYSILKADLPMHRQIPLAWEASTENAKKQVQLVIQSISDITFEAKEEQRSWLHLSAVLGNNFINHLMALCEQICKEQHMPFSLLIPILEQTRLHFVRGILLNTLKCLF
jgi:predicted short-subunit dehydrogenase-like oxidoreductase (DUF2520 family)